MDYHGLGGGGIAKGASKLLKHCGSEEELKETMFAIKDASTRILEERSKKSQYKNVAIVGHYPDWCQDGVDFRNMYINNMPRDKVDRSKIFNFFGHTHIQQCFDEEHGECVNFLSGGGGGCCGGGAASVTCSDVEVVVLRMMTCTGALGALAAGCGGKLEPNACCTSPRMRARKLSS
mmetsp:Transcript_91878/g.256788  ORF Transcript_91878/g.256788 Transcript_91878/m.256788 type:complete len:177 (+) Transcript_91878:131-661(+)